MKNLSVEEKNRIAGEESTLSEETHPIEREKRAKGGMTGKISNQSPGPRKIGGTSHSFRTRRRGRRTQKSWRGSRAKVS